MVPCTGWQRCIGCPKSQVSVRQRATNSSSLLRKMSYNDLFFSANRVQLAHKDWEQRKTPIWPVWHLPNTRKTRIRAQVDLSQSSRRRSDPDVRFQSRAGSTRKNGEKIEIRMDRGWQRVEMLINCRDCWLIHCRDSFVRMPVLSGLLFQGAFAHESCVCIFQRVSCTL